jgi:general L-amino acid transport system permease protein
MEAYVQETPVEVVKPPVTSVGVIGWARANLFNGWLNSLLTIVTLYFLWIVIPPLIRWAFIDSVWNTSGAVCRDADGACWSIIATNFRFILFGFFPYDQQWRPLIAMLLLFGLLFYSRNRNHWTQHLIYAWIIGLVLMGVLMRGGIFWLSSVEPTQWGGLPLTLLLSVFGLTIAYPLGVIFALGRQSKMPTIKWMSIVYIELIRGVPLISLLFMGSFIFPLFLPEGVNLPTILRALIAIIIFTAAYIAEVLNYFLTMRLIILPQALKIVIPPTVQQLISAFKDTSLVVIIALFDLLKTSQTVLSNPEWMGFSREAYIFVAILYFLGCFSMANYSRKLEKELSTEN